MAMDAAKIKLPTEVTPIRRHGVRGEAFHCLPVLRGRPPPAPRPGRAAFHSSMVLWSQPRADPTVHVLVGQFVPGKGALGDAKEGRADKNMHRTRTLDRAII